MKTKLLEEIPHRLRQQLPICNYSAYIEKEHKRKYTIIIDVSLEKEFSHLVKKPSIVVCLPYINYSRTSALRSFIKRVNCGEIISEILERLCPFGRLCFSLGTDRGQDLAREEFFEKQKKIIEKVKELILPE